MLIMSLIQNIRMHRELKKEEGVLKHALNHESRELDGMTHQQLDMLRHELGGAPGCDLPPINKGETICMGTGKI